MQIATFANEAGLVPLGGGLFQASANSGAPITGSPGSPGLGTISQAETASLSFTLDTSAPQPANHLANDTGVSQTDAVTSDATLTGLAAPNETRVFTKGTLILGTTTASAAGIWTFVPPNLADGKIDLAHIEQAQPPSLPEDEFAPVEVIGVRSTTTRAHAIATMRAQDVAQRVGDLVRITIAGDDPPAIVAVPM